MAFVKVVLTGAKNTIKEGFTALNNLITDLLSTSTGKGASQIGVEDSAGNLTAVNVEAAIAEIYTDHASTKTLAEVFDENPDTTTGTVWGWKAGAIRVDNAVTTVAAGTIALVDDDVNYIEITQAGVVSKNTTGFNTGRIPIRQITAASGVQTVSTDKRAWFVQVAAATATTQGTVELATDAETQTGTATDRVVTPANLSARTSTTARTGVVELATDGETTTGTDTARAVTPANLKAMLGDLTDGGILVGSGAAAVTALGVGSLGQVPVSQGTGDPVYEYQPKQNLLTNSGFGVWSNSTLEDVGSDLVVNGDMATWDGSDPDLPTGWTNSGADAGEISDGGGVMTLNVSATTEGCHTNTFTTETGKLYEITGSFTRTSGSLIVYLRKGDNSGWIDSTTLTATDATFSFVAEETAGGAGAYVLITSTGGAANWEIDDVACYEVTPGCVAADSLGPDGWYKVAALDLHREHSGSNTKDGSFYSLKLNGSAQYEAVRWPLYYKNAEWLAKMAGRTITVGAWVWSDDDFTMYLYDGVAYAFSYHSSGSGWEWLEASLSVNATPTEFAVQFQFQGATQGTVYISQPMLVFGSSIGEGNYSAPSGEIVWFEGQKELTGYAGSATQDTTGVTLNLEVLSDGVIPKGIKAVCVGYFRGSCATVEKVLYLEGIGNNTDLCLAAQVANVWNTASGWSSCDSNGDVLLDAQDTFNEILIRVIGVQL